MSMSAGTPGSVWGARMKCRKGFSLLEVIVAFALTSIVLAAVYSAFAGASNRASRAVDRQYAALLAESMLEETLALPAKAGRRSGVFHGYEWTVTTTRVSRAISPISMLNDARAHAPEEQRDSARLYKVFLRVQWNRGRAKKVDELVLVSYRLEVGADGSE